MGFAKGVFPTVGLVTIVLAASPRPLAAQTLSASDLAGPGQGFREMSVNLGDDLDAGSGAAAGGLSILGGLDSLPRQPSAESATPSQSFQIHTVPDRLPANAATTFPSGSAPAPAAARADRPTLLVPAPVGVPTVRLQPVPTTLSEAGLAPTVRPRRVPAPVTSPVTSSPEAPVTTSSPPVSRPAPSAPVPPSFQDGDAESGQPTLIRADELVRDSDLGTYTARGNVELSNAGRVILADMVTFNERTDMVTANGNVRVVEADGTTYFANYVELTRDFRDGFVRDMAVLLSDRSRISAVYATRTEGRRKDFWKGVYSPCDTCPTTDGSPWPTLSGNNDGGERDRQYPLWQIRAAHVTHDEEVHDIIYRDATLELFGIPVAYTPYMSQPDPTVYRRSGLLSPSFGSDDQIGTWIETPYYYAFDDHQDATMGVRFMTDEGWLLHPEYRRRFADGEFSVDGSLTDDSADGLSGHVNARGQWHINDAWRAGFNSEYASSDTYLDVYGFSNPTWLTNHAWVETFQNRNYAAIEALSYTDNRVNRDDAGNPHVLPLMTYDYISDPGTWGDTLRLSSEFQNIYRIEGTDSTRLSGSVGWTLPGTTGWGLAYDLSTTLNTDLYWINGEEDEDFDGALARIYPDALMTLRYPLMRARPDNTQILEPIVSLGLAPSDLNTHHIPNEDSRDAALYTANLFSGDRFSGRDRVDDGVRVNYGLRWTWLGPEGRRIAAQFGQAYRLTDASDFFADGVGYGKGLSDYVGRVDLVPHPYVDLFYRYRLDRDDLDLTANALGFRIGPPVFNVTGTYVAAPAHDEDDETALSRRKEIVGGVNMAFSRYWNAAIGGRYDLERSRKVNTWTALNYEDECLALGLRFTTNYNELNGEEVGQSIVVQVTLKSLGDVDF